MNFPKIILGSVFFMLLILNTRAQVNLVPNPSFEEYEDCNNTSITTAMEWVVDWFNPNLWSSDYWTSVNLGTPCTEGGTGGINPYLVPESFDSNFIVGSYYYVFEQEESGVREYVEVELTEPLVAGNSYAISYNVSMGATSKYRINSMGCYFSETAFTDYLTVGALEADPQVEVDTLFGSPYYWIQIRDTIVANGGEKFMTVGNFKHNDEIELEQISEDSDAIGSYYVLDKFNVSLITNVGIKEPSLDDVKIWYNTDEDLLIVKNSSFSNNLLEIFDASGRKILDDVANGKKEISTQKFSSGLYLVKVNSKKGNLIYKFLKQKR
jgi:OmpA-OmpF porin, OOP family